MLTAGECQSHLSYESFQFLGKWFQDAQESKEVSYCSFVVLS